MKDHPRRDDPPFIPWGHAPDHCHLTKMQFATHFSLVEFLRSRTAHQKTIDNTPDHLYTLNNLHALARQLENIRIKLDNNPIFITSGYRSPELNHAVGGQKTSRHLAGLAADFICPGFGDPKAIFEALREKPPFGCYSIGLETTWIHYASCSVLDLPSWNELIPKFWCGPGAASKWYPEGPSQLAAKPVDGYLT